VILVRDQTLSDQDLIAFSRRFGDLDWAPVQETGRRFVEGLPEIYIVSNVTVNGQPIGSLGAGEAVWHTDMSYLDVPPMASMLYALEIPSSGGNTSFCSMYAIYERLPAELKRRIADLKIKHDGTYNSGGFLRQGVAATDDPRTSPGAVHPLVCTHPETRRRMLYLGRRRNAYIAGSTTSGDFPVAGTAPFQSSSSGGTDAFLTKVSSNGTSLVYSTYLGGSAADSALALTVNTGQDVVDGVVQVRLLLVSLKS